MKRNKYLILLLIGILSLEGCHQAEQDLGSLTSSLTTNTPLGEEWRYDKADFTRSDDWIHLSPSEKLREGQSHIFTTTLLPEHPVLRGEVLLHLLPSEHNYSYIFLCCTESNHTTKHFRYISLRIGGGSRKGIALTEVELSRQNNEHRGKTELILHSENILVKALNFEVAVDKKFGYIIIQNKDNTWELHLYHQGDREATYIGEGELDHPTNINPHNTIGILCHYTAKHREAWQWQVPTISDIGSLSTSSEATNPMPIESNQEVNKDPSQTKLYLSEIMANPLPSSCEYIELYNDLDTPQSLQNIHLGIGKSTTNLRYYPLDKLPDIPPHGCLVLATSPESIITSYPHTPIERLQSYPLSRLANNGFSIVLRDGNGKIIDALDYTPALLGKGLKSKHGVALERTTYTNGSTWQAVPKTQGYASPGRPSSSNSPTSTPTTNEFDDKEVSTLSQVLQLWKDLPKENIVCIIHDTRGQSLYQLHGEKAWTWLIALNTSPQETIHRLPLFSTGVYHARILVTTEDGDAHSYDHPFIFY